MCRLTGKIGPIIGGYIAARTTWRWMFWSTSIFQAGMIFVSFFSFPESYGALILQRRAERLRQQTGNNQYYTEGERLESGKSAAAIVARALTRPLRLLIFHPVIQASALMSGFNYGILYITLSTFSNLWISQYHQSVEISGLHYIACSLGEIAGSQISGPMMDYFYKRRQTQNPSPESRIPLMFPGIIIGWLGMLAYGWTAEYRLFWLVVDVMVFIMLFGMQLGGMCCKYLLEYFVTFLGPQNKSLTRSVAATAYVIDSYGEHTSSAMAATQFIKSLTAFLFPLFAPSMYQALGYGRTNSILALTGSILTISIPILIWRHGARFRAKASSTY